MVEAKKEGETLTGVELQTTKYIEGIPDNLRAASVPGLPAGPRRLCRYRNCLNPESTGDCARSRLPGHRFVTGIARSEFCSTAKAGRRVATWRTGCIGKKACTTAAPQPSAPSLPVSTYRSTRAGPRLSVSPIIRGIEKTLDLIDSPAGVIVANLNESTRVL